MICAAGQLFQVRCSLGLVHWRSADIHLCDIRYDALYGSTRIARTSVIRIARFRRYERCSVSVLATKWTRHATGLLQLFHCVSGDYFVRALQCDSTEPYAISLRSPGATPLLQRHDRLARFQNRALLPEGPEALRVGIYRQLRMQE